MPSVGNEVISLVGHFTCVCYRDRELLRAQVSCKYLRYAGAILSGRVLCLLVTGVVTFALNKVEQRVEY